ncbi:MAG: MotA/TolQ/ExbB proton channel family protein [Planctomycetota bacterium]
MRAVLLAAALAAPALALPQDDAEVAVSGQRLEETAAKLGDSVREADAELRAVRERATKELLPLRERLGALRSELIAAEDANREAARLKSEDASALLRLTRSIDAKKKQTSRLSALLNEYVNNFRSRTHIAEKAVYADLIGAAESALGDADLSQSDIFVRQLAVLDASFARISELPGGLVVEGSALDPDGIERRGKFVIVGPAGVFRSEDGKVVGTAERELERTLPVIKTFSEEVDTVHASTLVASGTGQLPVDITGNKAHKIASTKETLVEHVQKGGAIIYPILVMAALALLVALYKWISFLFLRGASKKKVKGLTDAVAEGDADSAKRRAAEIKGPIGGMLQAGVANMERSRDLMEDSMYEKVLVSKTSLNSWLPFIAVCAASAPLLGLLGTVTGIINTFKQITIFGSGDVKSLSGGISEALITTKFGLIVAIPSLLLHAYLSRRARGMVTKMEANAVHFANEVARSDKFGEAAEARRRVATAPMMAPEHEVARAQVTEILSDILGPLSNDPQATLAPGGGSGNGVSEKEA